MNLQKQAKELAVLTQSGGRLSDTNITIIEKYLKKTWNKAVKQCLKTATSENEREHLGFGNIKESSYVSAESILKNLK